jgi:hypothetical protein
MVIPIKKAVQINVGLLSLAYTYQISLPVDFRVFQQEGKEVGTVQHVDTGQLRE